MTLPILIVLGFAVVILGWQFRRLRLLMVERNRELDDLRRRSSEYIANISHELKTPLTSIKGYAETLKSGAIRDPEKAIEFLDRINENTDRLSLLIHDILELSRIESTHFALSIESVSVPQLLDGIEKLFAMKVVEKKQNLSFKTEADVIKGDRRLIEQTLINLIENAHRYCQEGAEIKISVAHVHEQGRAWTRISVSDNGPGIAQGDLHRIFERFYRAEKSRTRSLGGTGLGLAIVKHIVISHGGLIRAQSEPGSGATFILLFPR